MGREYFCAYHSYLDSIKRLTNEERGRLFSACLAYSMTGEEPDLTGNEVYVWDGIRSQIDRDQRSYEDVCKKRTENINKRWEGHEKQPIQKYTNVYKGIQSDTKHTKEKEKEKEKDKEKDILPNSADKPHKSEVKDELEQAIIFFKEHRKKLGKPMTDHAADLLRKKLEELAPNDKKKQADLVDYAITKGWQSVYLPDEKDRKQSNGNGGLKNGSNIERDYTIMPEGYESL